MNSFNGKPFYLNEIDFKWINDTLAAMTEEEKLGQLFCLITYTADEEYLQHLIKDLHVGGIMLRTMESDEIVQSVSISQQSAKIPLLISANLEAGLNQTCVGGTRVGCQMAIAATADVSLAGKLGEIVGSESTALGINWAFAPVVDLDLNFRNPITNTRTFGNDTQLVSEMGAAYIKAVQASGMAASAKHFPGDGVDELDQHLAASVNSMTPAQWDDSFGKIYKRMIDVGVKTIMAGHILLPEYSKLLNPELEDKDILPGIISKELLDGLLRKQLGFNGLIITDSTTMAGMGTCLPREKALPLAIAAGCDMLLFTKNLSEDFEFIRHAIRTNIITQKRLDEAVSRILALKASLGLHKKQGRGELIPDKREIISTVGHERHKRISLEVAQKSITIIKEEDGVMPISPERYPRVLVYNIEGNASATSMGITEGAADKFIDLLKRQGYEVDKFVSSGGWEGMAAPLSAVTDKYDLIIYIANLATKSNQTVVRPEWAEPMGADVPVYMHTVPTIFISLENPYHLLDVPRVRTYINTYGSTDEIQRALLDKLQGNSPFVGKSPVDAFCGRWDARL